MGLDRAKGMDGMLQEGPLLYRKNKTKQWHRGLRQEVLERSKQKVGIIKD
jgi:hypothetical protein